MEKNYEFRTLIKKNALFKLTEAIRYTDCSIERLKKFIFEHIEYFAADEWEEIRLAHSQIFNTNKMTGTLCLSIHPLDYATASDNDNGWSSCMSWRDDGCYRMGTVEMMNSPMVICAYFASCYFFPVII